MEIEEKHNPNERDTPKSWSDLPLDLLNSVFERLSFVNFQRAKAVCSSWHSALRQCVPKNNQILPWLIIFPEDNENNNSYSCTLINPEEKDKRYRTQDLGLELAKSFCIAIYGNWLLIRNPLHNLYILNFFSNERINLPPVESQLGTTKMERTFDDDEFRITGHNGKEYKGISIRSPVFWIDEKTKDYVVLWLLRELCVVYSKKGDTSWSQIPDTSCRWCHMVYKDSKLYYLSFSGCFFIFDLSGEIPLQTFQRGVNVEFSVKSPTSTRLVVTVTGDVLKVEKMWRSRSRTWSFRVFNVYSSSGFLKKHQLIDSLGDNEAMLLDQGITVLANDTDGFIRNCIYFSVSHRMITNDIFLFNLKTQKTEPVHIFDWSSIQFSRARRFFPSFSQT